MVWFAFESNQNDLLMSTQCSDPSNEAKLEKLTARARAREEERRSESRVCMILVSDRETFIMDIHSAIEPSNYEHQRKTRRE